jgi:hypothetical protein
LKSLTDWIAATGPSLMIQRHEAWAIPAIQSIHIAAIGVVLACVLMLTLRILGYAGMDLTLVQTEQRFGPWLRGALWLLLCTGLVMVIGEPERELVTFSFWAKMTLVALGSATAFGLHRMLRTRGQAFEQSLADRKAVKIMAVVSLLVWLAIVVLGRLIAYDHIWGPLSPATKA